MVTFSNGQTSTNLMCGISTPPCCATPGTVTTCFSGATTTCCNGFNNCNRVTTTAVVSTCYVGGTYAANGYTTTQAIAQQTCFSPKNQVYSVGCKIFVKFLNLGISKIKVLRHLDGQLVGRHVYRLLMHG